MICNAACAQITVRPSEFGSLQSPNYPYSYPNYGCVCWMITASPGYIIHLEFQTFAIQDSYDYVKVFDGSSVYAPNLLTATGYSSPGVVHSTSSRMLVTFFSDAYETNRGFVGNFFLEESYFTPTETSPMPTDFTPEFISPWPTLPPSNYFTENISRINNNN